MANSDNPQSPTASLSPPPSTTSNQRPKNVLRTRVSFTSSATQSGSPVPSSSGFAFPFNPAYPATTPLQSPSAYSETSEEPRPGRGRSSSLLSVHEVQDNYDDQLDQGVGPNLNADWVDYKGSYFF